MRVKLLSAVLLVNLVAPAWAQPAPPPAPPVVNPPRHTHAEKPKTTHRTAHPQASATAAPATAKPTAKPAVVAPAPSAPAPPAAPVVATDAAVKKTGTGLELPRFASFRFEDVNMRVGPGTTFQIDWVYHRRDLPVKIEREYDVWRQIEDQDGVKGWVHQQTLAGRRSFVVKDAERTLRAAAADDAAAVARLKPGVVGRIRTCAANAAWCEVQVGDYRGFLKREEFWGTFPNEAVN